MSNSEQSVAIVRKTFTIAITFVSKPSLERRQQMKDAGYLFSNGQWFKSSSEGQHADEETVARIVAAS